MYQIKSKGFHVKKKGINELLQEKINVLCAVEGESNVSCII